MSAHNVPSRGHSEPALIADYVAPEKLISKAKFLLGDSTLHADDEANLHVIALALTAIADMMAKTRGALIDGLEGG